MTEIRGRTKGEQKARWANSAFPPPTPKELKRGIWATPVWMFVVAVMCSFGRMEQISMVWVWMAFLFVAQTHWGLLKRIEKLEKKEPTAAP